MKNKYIAIEGNIGVGKTTLAEFLANHFKGSLLLEEFAENKFLKLFYQTKDYAFHSEMQFLLDRSLQMNTFFEQDHSIVFSDFHIEKSLVFSNMNLSKSNYCMVENIHKSLFKNYPTPDMLIFLDSDIEQISKNIKSRNRDFEKDLGTEYLENLIKNYNFWLNKLKIPINKKTRSLIGLVPQEFPLENFESVIETVKFSRGLFGKSPDPFYIEKILKSLNLWEKKDTPIIALSGGMKRRVLIAKALSHKPKILFLDEPTSGVDVQLRKGMWDLISTLKKDGVTVILTTHYIKEAEVIADRVGILSKGKLILVEEKKDLIQKFGKKIVSVELKEKLKSIPKALSNQNVSLSKDNQSVLFEVNNSDNQMSMANTLKVIVNTGLSIKDVNTIESSLEDIFLEIIADEESS